MKSTHPIVVFLSTVLLFSGAAMAEESAEAKSASASKTSLSGHIVTVGHYRNDSDFDRTERFDDLDGQSDAQIATFFAPRLTIEAGQGIDVVYELELGWNAWSRNDPGAPNQFLPAGDSGLALRHKQAYAQWESETAAVKVGYQHYRDPTGLFLNHHTGLVAAQWHFGKTSVSAVGGQLPDSTYEGVSIREDNFATDSFVGGIGARHDFGDMQYELMGYAVLDERSLERPLKLFTGILAINNKRGSLECWLQGVGQTGTWENSGVGGGDQSIGAWAAQVGMKQDLGRVSWRLNFFSLSGDDAFDGNDLAGNFLGSGKNNSHTVFMTEDETRDRYDNLDERLGSTWGPFSTNRAGLMVVELALGAKVLEGWDARLVGAYGQALEADNALGEELVGTEVALLQRFALGDRASVFLNGFVFAPGAAASAAINDIDRAATETLYGVATGMHAQF